MPTQMRIVLLGLAAVALAVVAVAGAGAVAYLMQPGSSNASSETASIAGTAATIDVVLNAAQVSEASAGQSAAVREILKDGRLSFDEYRGAFLRFVACAESRGAKAEWPPTVTRRGKLQVKLTFSAGDGASVGSDIQGCKAENFSVVDSLWSMHVAPSKEELQQAREALAACLRTAGFLEVPERPVAGELVKFWPGHESALPPVAFEACKERVDTEYDLPGFGG